MTASRRITALVAAVIVTCFGILAAPIAFARVSVLPQVGQSCTQDSVILSTQGCYNNIIQCKPGYSACGGKCVDIASDVDHCGACARQCPGASNGLKICSVGICQSGFHPPRPHPYISKPVTLVSGSAWEFKPTRSQTTGDLFAINGSGGGLKPPLAGSGCSNYYSVVKFDNKGVIKSVSPDKGFYQSEPWGDSWATSSGYAGLELFSFFDAPFQADYDEKNVYLDPNKNQLDITVPFSSTTPCPGSNPLRTAGIGATTMANLTTPQNWDAPVYTWFRPEAEDGQNYYADPGGTGLFGVGADGWAEWSRWINPTTGGHEIATGGPPWRTYADDKYPGFGAALWIAPNCYAFPNLNPAKNASLIQTNQGYALSPNCQFAKFGGDYLSPHDQALIDQGIVQPGTQDNTSYSYFDATSGDAVNGFHGGDLWHHVTVDANPCTHNAIVAYTAGTREVHIKFITPDGKVTGHIIADTLDTLDLPYPISSYSASDVNGRYVSRVSLATTADRSTQKCYLYTAYDFTDRVAVRDVPLQRIYAKMKVWDITDEKPQSWTPVQSYSAADYNYWPSWHSTVSASVFDGSVGWFFYNLYTNVTFQGFVGDKFATQGMTDLGVLSTTNLPVYPGGGDYIQAMPGGDRGGLLVPTWAENGNIVARWVAP